MSDRERLGKDYKLPAISKADATTIEDGVRAWSRLKANSVMQDWLAVGRALLIGRKLCMAQVNAKKPRGVKYVTANSAWVKKHGFDEISRCGRQTSMLVVEHLPEIEAWLLTLSDDKRTGLNHPQVIWSQFRAYRQGCDETKSRQGWRDKQLSEERFGKLFEAIDDTLETGDPLVIAIAAARALGYSVPKEILQDQKHYRQSRVTIRPALAYAPWTPFEMRL